MLLSFLIYLASLLYVIVLSQSSMAAFAIVLGIDILLNTLIGISIYGMCTGTIHFLNMKGRKGSIGLFIVSVFFLFYVSGLGLLSILLDGNSEGKIPSFKESVSAVTNYFIPIGYKQGLLTEPFEGITFHFPKGEETSIHTIKDLYPKAKESLDKIYGKDSFDNFTIIIYDNADELNSRSHLEQLSGFYLPNNCSIHMVSDKLLPLYAFEDNFFHEYAHYRSDQFFKKHHISAKSIPQWFNEGISEFVAHLDTYVDIDLKEVINFTDIDTNDDFHEARHDDFDPYLQSYFAVKELVLEHGLDIIPNLIQATKDKMFYSAFQEITGVKIAKFQTTFLNRRGRIKELLTQAEEAGKKNEYKNEENLYLEINRLDSYSMLAERNLPYLYIKQGEFEKAMDQLKAFSEPDASEYQMLAELSLLTSPQESLKYAEREEEKIKKNIGDESFTLDFADAIRKTVTEPVIGYLLLFNKELITYKELRKELSKKLKQLYPSDQRIQKLES